MAIIFVRHGSTKYPGAEKRLRQIYDTHLSGIDTYTVIVDNGLDRNFTEEIDAANIVIGGDNTSWEFSGWDRGLAFLGRDLWSYDLVHLVTSAFDTLYTAYLDLLTEKMLSAVARRPACLGHIDFYNEPVQILSFRSQHWVRSSFLFTPPTELKMLRSLVSVSESIGFSGGTVDNPFDPGISLSSNYQHYVLDWLTGSDIGQGTSWHTKLTLTSNTLPYFRSKARAIFNEHLLSIRLRAQGTRLIDTTWLTKHIDSTDPKGIDWSTFWQDQMGSRYRAGSVISSADELARLSG